MVLHFSQVSNVLCKQCVYSIYKLKKRDDSVDYSTITDFTKQLAEIDENAPLENIMRQYRMKINFWLDNPSKDKYEWEQAICQRNES